MDSIPLEWLKRKVEIKGKETEDSIQKRRKKPRKLGQNDKSTPSLESKKAMVDDFLKPGDEIWEFCSPPESWELLCGRSGLALVRDGKVIRTFVHTMN